ncbi:YlbF family regulator [Paenibacillus contaminans]|uniref:YlbF family regulator n=1 Tax=Paenibacillus contaminans TaxID=450362 RepID=A0A329MIY2_9BACL|nr:YlbF family regulator [Paenibacillus contaminans]RAV19931.1 YlbF family regulator [Paenibacillus contaminans]
MSILEAEAIDMAGVLMHAYELGDLINGSAEVSQYLYWKRKVEQDEEVKRLVRLFAKKKELFEECERFGHFHPDYHAAMDEVKRVQAQLDGMEAVRQFKEAEERVDDLLYQISKTIAHAVSETVKVPSNNPLADGGGCGSGGCSSGGSCSGNCG